MQLCSIFQRYKSKAIHNLLSVLPKEPAAVFNISKIQIESNSQRAPQVYNKQYSCVQYFKDTNRKQFTTQLALLDAANRLCSIFQRYKSKAIHNQYGQLKLKFEAVFNISKIQIESNSQLFVFIEFFRFCCVQYFKDTNRKQFTTVPHWYMPFCKLCSIFQRYKSKAIHNAVRGSG